MQRHIIKGGPASPIGRLLRGFVVAELADDDLAVGRLGVDEVCPCLHHHLALVDELCAVVGSDDFAAVGMGKLAFDDVGLVVQFLADRRACEGAEAVTGHAAFVTEIVQSFQDGVVADRLARLVRAWEYI